MWLKVFGSVALVSGLIAGAFFVWCDRRWDIPVCLKDTQFPRPWPYPDGLLVRWHDRIDAENPSPPGHKKIEGEYYTLKGRLHRYAAPSFSLAVVGAAALAYRPLKRRLEAARSASVGSPSGQ
jgi:hypothetical protein